MKCVKSYICFADRKIVYRKDFDDKTNRQNICLAVSNQLKPFPKQFPSVDFTFILIKA